MDSKLLKHFKWIPVTEVERPKSGLNRTFVNNFWITREVNGALCIAIYKKGSIQCNANESVGAYLYGREIEAGIFTVTQIPVASIPWDDHYGVLPAWFERHALTDHSYLENHLMPSEQETGIPKILS